MCQGHRSGADRVVDVADRGGILRLGRHAEIDRHDEDPRSGERLMHCDIDRAVIGRPGAAMNLDNAGKGPLPTRPVEPRQKRLLAMADILDVLDTDRVGT